MSNPEIDEILKVVRDHYGRAANNAGGCGSNAAGTGCCGGAPENAAAICRSLGYTNEQLQTAGQGASLGLGCGNPHAFSRLREGDVVLDLGSGGGIDCFIAARAVGQTGRVIGVDMTPEMVELARQNAKKMQTANVEFRLGEIAGGKSKRRCDHLKLCDQPVPGQGSGLSRSLPGAETRRPAGRLRRGGHRAAAAAHSRRRIEDCRLCCRRTDGRQSEGRACIGGLCRYRGPYGTAQPAAGRARVAGWRSCATRRFRPHRGGQAERLADPVKEGCR